MICYSVTKGYWKDPELTSQVLNENGWYDNGDYFSMDEKGHFYFKSRCKELITVKGSGKII